MPMLGLGTVHILIALFFAVHAVKNGRQLYWIIILFSAPFLGSVVYFFAEYLPASKLERGISKASNKALQLIDPKRALREAQYAFDLTPTVQNRMHLAAALDDAGEYQEAVNQFEACLKGPFAKDPEVLYGAAKAKLHIGQATQTIGLLTQLRQLQKEFRAEQVGVLLALAYAQNQENALAKTEFTHATKHYGSAETRLQYALWAAKVGDIATAQTLKAGLDKDWKHWNKHSRALHQDLFSALERALRQSN